MRKPNQRLSFEQRLIYEYGNMRLKRIPSVLRALFAEGPAFTYYHLFSWLYHPWLLRYKAAGSPYPHVRELLMRRSGLSIGKKVYLGFGVLVLGTRRKPPIVTLKDRASVGPYVTFLTTSYPNYSVLQSHPEVADQILMIGPIVVEEDAWIGAGVIIFPGVRIGRGAIVGAGAVVTRDIAPWTVTAGVPARQMRTLSPATSPN